MDALGRAVRVVTENVGGEVRTGIHRGQRRAHRGQRKGYERDLRNNAGYGQDGELDVRAGMQDPLRHLRTVNLGEGDPTSVLHTQFVSG
jgi:hypothetical protein